MLASGETVGEGLAYRRFGKELVESTLPLYHDDYHAMLADDDRLGALPTLLHLKPSNWILNIPRLLPTIVVISLASSGIERLKVYLYFLM